ncbi:hypothetical protein AVEN_26232-1 [Araneus ventricosus]|uniref:Uncharacterized protein n=1 Tax=Araneus ventricosus TaxID=182803 RepID=A0A4Y2ANG7_ARAVE|nr:hypothetical protein AVEN_26232-1 [Araneus ventricosus]
MQLLAPSIPYSDICKYETSMTMNTLSEVQHNVFVQFVFDNADHITRTVDGHGTFHVMGGVRCVTHVSAVQTCSCIPPWIALDFARTGVIYPTRGTTCCTGDECNELDYYLSTTVKYPVQKFAPTWGPTPCSSLWRHP